MKCKRSVGKYAQKPFATRHYFNKHNLINESLSNRCGSASLPASAALYT